MSNLFDGVENINKKNIRLNINEIDNHTNNEMFSIENIDELAESIKKYGLMQAIGVKKYGERYVVIYGHRRLEALKKLVEEGLYDYETIVCNLVDENEKEENTLDRLLTTNLNSRQLTKYEYFEIYKQLVVLDNLLPKEKKEGRQRTRIAKKMNVSENFVKDLQFFANYATDIDIDSLKSSQKSFQTLLKNLKEDNIPKEAKNNKYTKEKFDKSMKKIYEYIYYLENQNNNVSRLYELAEELEALTKLNLDDK